MNNTIRLTLDSASVFVLHAIAGCPMSENGLRAFMQADSEGREILARDIRAPGRQLDALEARGFISFDGNQIVTTDMLKHLVITVAE